MTVLNVVQAVNHALREEMARNDKVIILGEDVGVNGGVFRATEGLYQEFGPNRVIDTPLAESGIIGVSIGMALYGLRPVPEIQFMDFIYPGFDQIQSELAKFRYRSGGQYTTPVVIRTPYGGGIRGSHYHSQSTEAFFAHTPGLKVVIPATPYDAKGLLTSAMRDPDPVMFLEPKKIYRTVRGEVPNEEYTVPIGKANIAREGNDVVVFAYGAMLHVAMEAAELAAAKNINVEVVDIRSIAPFDIETI
ncbi:MAG TPA: alpha-ketoacid dehydrogenase subunit beta, partial [Candidatus Acidoferrales bacterium]|nr:alpha-ketoacid dehydrogenase subunit beta [Candidatus Acidoferrales bacterium]